MTTSTRVEPSELDHRGRAAHRLEAEPRERAFADVWQAWNTRPSDPTFFSDLIREDASQRDAEIAATLVQWLGSPVGFDFLAEALERAGYEITPRAAPK